ncbi:MAG: sulfotransferase [Phycisphaerales bacterium]|nr:sulfotransferase [Phycisphaerales bacterium]
MTGQPRAGFFPGEDAPSNESQGKARILSAEGQQKETVERSPQVSMGPPDPSGERRDGAAAPDPAAQAREESARGDVLYLSGDFARAFNRYQEAVRLQPANADYHFRLASAAWKTGDSRPVKPHFEEAIRLNPRHLLAYDAMAQWSMYLGDMAAALDYSAKAMALAPEDPNSIISRAQVLEGDGQPLAAWRLLEPLIASGLQSDRAMTIYALLAPKVGHEAQAAAMIERRLQDRRSSPRVLPDLHFAAAALYDRIGRYEEAFAHARQGNGLIRRPFNPATNSAIITAHINYFTSDRLRSLPCATHGNGRPVLIVGMPRSGTSLVEQILASHPEVFGAGELSALNFVARSLESAARPVRTLMPMCLDQLSLEQANIAAADYLRQITAINSTARYVTDKLPSNFLYLGLAEILFPECHVIHCVRDPRDTCLSCYFTYFASGNAFSFDLGQLAGFYRDYRRMMQHWKQVLTLPMLDVRYEDVVADVEGQTRRMLEFLDLPWDDRCLRFHENKRPVVTSSRDQVRRPLYASSVGRWQHYQRHIPELLALVPDGT